MEKNLNFINGIFTAAQSNNFIENINPATEDVISRVADSNEDDVEQAVAAAKRAFGEHSRTSVQERAAMLGRIADGIEKRADELALAETRDQGKPLWLSKKVDIPRAAHNFRFFASAILQDQEMSVPHGATAFSYTQKMPIGVCGLIAPWNLPLYLITWKIAPAIAMGNTCVAKPSELTTTTATLLGEILQEAKVPPGVVNVVHGFGEKAGHALTSHPDVPLISFTGGTQTALAIQNAAAPHYKKLGLELGGKNPNIIFDDANLEKAVETSLKSSFLNQGEICLCGSRIFVQEGIYKEFLSQFVDKVKDLKVGNPEEEDTFIGPLVSEAHRSKVVSSITQAEELGGRLECGGTKPPEPEGYYVSPTVITGLDPSCSVNQDEIFGPVVTVTPFKTDEEAIELANGVRYGLAASIWTEKLGRAHQVAQQIEAGTVWVNCWLLRDLRVPFGGMKASGMGREGGRYSLEFYAEHKNICVDVTL